MWSWRWRYVWLALCVGVLGAGCQCVDGPLQTGKVEIRTDLPGEKRPALIFSDIVVGQAKTANFLLFNEGDQPLIVTGMTVQQDVQKVFSLSKIPSFPLEIKPGKSNGVQISVQIKPPSSEDFQALLAVESTNATNVEEDGKFYIQLRHRVLTPLPVFSCNRRLDFGQVAVGKEKTMQCELRNQGNAPLTVKGARYEKQRGSKADFSWKAPAFPVTLKPNGEPLTIKIVYRPSDAVPLEDVGVFALETNITDPAWKSRLQIQVSGITLAPKIALVPIYPTCQSENDCSKIERTLVCLNDGTGTMRCGRKPGQMPLLQFPLTGKNKRTLKRFVIRSTGKVPLTITKISLDTAAQDGFAFTGPTLPLTLAPQETKEVVVTYAPTRESQKGKGTLYVESNDPVQTRAPLALVASAFGCVLEVTPKKLSFVKPQGRRLTLFNRGNQSCQVSKVYLKSTDKSLFSLLPTAPSNIVIAPGGRYDLLVRFNAKDKNKVSELLLIESNDADEPTIEVQLEGKVVGDRPCQLALTPSTLQFRLVTVGKAKKLRLQVENKGWDTCKISSVQLLSLEPSGVQSFRFAQPVNAPVDLLSGQLLTWDVIFTPPQDAPTYRGKIVIASNDTLSPNLEVQLLGASGTPCLEIVPENIDFGSTKFGCATRRRKIEAYNLGAKGCNQTVKVTGIKCTPGDCWPKGNNADFRINQAPIFPVSLGLGQKVEIQMSYKPSKQGVSQGALEIANDIPGQSPFVIPLIGEGVSTDSQKDVFQQPRQSSADILFVVDDSCSMRGEQTSLAQNFRSFVQWAVQLNFDYHIGVTTTDTRDIHFPGGCLKGSPKFIKSSTPNPVAAFAKNVQVGATAPCCENGLEGFQKALSPPRINDPKCNQGFLRKKASLSIIIVSDDDDHSKSPVSFFVGFLKNIKGFRDRHLTRVTIVGGPPPSGCRNGNESALPGRRYWDFAKQTGALTESICSKNWGQTLSRIGSLAFSYQRTFSLSRQADPKTIQVKVNGKVMKSDPQTGWVYEANENSIVFAKSQLPPPGATIEVSYKTICLSGN